MLVSTVADGAGSAKRSQEGSRIACQVVRESVALLLDVGGSIEDVDRIFAESILTRFQIVIDRIARQANARPRDFACTLLAAFVGPDRAAFLQVGDGAIVTAPGKAGATQPYDWVFWPENGEYANQTIFATADVAHDHLQFTVLHGAVEEVALFSDGLQNLVLDQKRRLAHAGFFEPMFRAVRKVEEPGLSQSLSSYLGRYLGSRQICGRTDDDKTLVLATKRLPEPAPALPRRPASEPGRAPAPEREGDAPAREAGESPSGEPRA